MKKTVENEPDTLESVPKHLKTKNMRENVVEKNPWLLKDVPGRFKTQDMCDKAVKYDPFLCCLYLIGL